jgi:hypothetical protein
MAQELLGKITSGINNVGNKIKEANQALANGNVQQPNTTGTELQYEVQNNNQANQAAMPTYKATTVETQPVQQTEQNQQMNTPIASQNIDQYIKPSSVSAKVPSDLYDSTVQGYMNDFQEGVRINDYQAQINALTALDQYRVSNGYEPIYSNTIYQLTNERTNKIKRNITDLDSQIAEAYNNGDMELAQQLGQELVNYKKMTNFNDTPDRYDPRDVAEYIQHLEYRSDYDQVINGIMNELLTTRFTYNPSEDEALIRAQQYAANTAYESMNARGILNSTMTAQIVTNTIASLIPTYEKMAREEFYDNVERLYSMANFVIDLDDRAYKRWQENTERNLAYYEALKDEASYQWDRVNQMGYVDNWASVVLGVAPGSLSPSARQAIQAQKDKIEQENVKLATDIALAQVKSQLDLETYAAKQAIQTQNYGTKKAIDAYYKNSGSTKTYTGELNATSLKKQLDIMAQDLDLETEEGKIELLKFASDNAKTRNDFAQAISGGDYYDGWTLAEADEILEKSAPKGTDLSNAIEDITYAIQDDDTARGYSDQATERKGKIIFDYYNQSDLTEDELQEILNYFNINLR